MASPLSHRLIAVFDDPRNVKLEDGRTLVVIYQGETCGWGAYVPGETKRLASAASPAEAIAEYLELPAEQIPAWAVRLSQDLERELREAQRYACECCGYVTLLNPGRYEVCRVCGWEDDRADKRPAGADTPSGPNHISLAQARANFARFGASTERRTARVRDPRPEEYPPS